MMISHYNEMYNAHRGFDLEQLGQMSMKTLMFFLENMSQEDMYALNKVIDGDRRFNNLKILKEKLEIYVTFS